MMGLEGRGLLDHDWDGAEARIVDASAPDWLVQTARATPFHLVAIGPLTNVAAACRLDPAFAGRVLGLTVMGGVFDEEALPERWRQAIRDQGARSWPDYNTLVDPEAALVCARSGAKLAWITSEVTHRIPLLRPARDRLARTGPLGMALARIIDSWYDGWFRMEMVEAGEQGAYRGDAVALLHDPLTLASLLPGSEQWLTMRPVRLRYAIEDGVFRMREAPEGGEGNARVSTAADADRFAAFCLERLVGYATLGSGSDKRRIRYRSRPATLNDG
jgi:purine nucleosidase